MAFYADVDGVDLVVSADGCIELFVVTVVSLAWFSALVGCRDLVMLVTSFIHSVPTTSNRQQISSVFWIFDSVGRSVFRVEAIDVIKSGSFLEKNWSHSMKTVSDNLWSFFTEYPWADI